MTSVTTTKQQDYLKSSAANIEGWNGSGKVFPGGESQIYNPNRNITPANFIE